MIDQRIKFRHIQCFVEICHEKSLKAAAKKLFLTQPAISKTLRELESILDGVLLIRNRGGVSLTPKGEVFYQFAEMSLQALQQGLDGVQEVSVGGNKRLSVGALPSVAARLMPDVSLEFAQLAPQTVLHVLDGPHGFLVERLRLGELDLVIGRLGQPETMDGVSFTQLYEERVVFVVRPDHPLIQNPDLMLVRDFPVIYPSKGSAIRSLVDRFLIAHGIGGLDQQLETVSGAFGRVHTQKTDAVWIISEGVVANELAAGRLVALPFDTSMTHGPVGLMYRHHDGLSPHARVFELAVEKVLKAGGPLGAANTIPK